MRRTLLTALVAALALGAAAACSPLQMTGAGPRGGYDHALQPVPNAAAAGQRAHGWRYFSDPQSHRAVVISPQGDYYLSQGRGLHWVAAAQGQA